MKNLSILSIAMLSIFFSCSSDKKQQVITIEKPLVKVETVKSQSVEQTQEFPATVEPNIVNNISPSMQVRIDNILVEVGDKVRKGQPLVQMDLVNLKNAKVQLDNLALEFSRTDELYKVGGISKSVWDAQKTQLDVTRASYKNLKENTELASPINGVVIARNYDKGDMFSMTKPVLTIGQIAPVKLIINVSESFYTKVKTGMNVKVKLDVYGNEEFTGKVSLIHPTINNQTRTFKVEIKVANADLRIRPGMFGRVKMNFGTLNHVVVPDVAVIKQAGAGDRYIYVYKDGKVSYNKVELGRQMGSNYEVISGVADGDQVVVAGQSRLNNGVEVSIEQK